LAILIDGYNLLNATGLFGHGKGPALERSRRALLNFLAATMEAEELSRTTVVFDAKDAPPGLPREFTYKGIRVLFAARFGEADDLIEKLIQSDHSPRQLLVVSSDHRLQRAAARRRATPIDCDKWYTELIRRRRTADAAGNSLSGKPSIPLSPEEVESWLDQFGDVDGNLVSANANDFDQQKTEAAEPDDQAHFESANPFPPGYAEDLGEEL
jgi:hypothetical protein